MNDWKNRRQEKRGGKKKLEAKGGKSRNFIVICRIYFSI